jgi:hypothetical protein
MANDFDKEPDGDRERQKKREREREEVEKAARDLANYIRSSSLISNHDPKIAVSVSGWTGRPSRPLIKSATALALKTIIPKLL